MNREQGAAAEGYADPTAERAIKKPKTRVSRYDDPEWQHLTETIEAVRAVLNASGYDMLGRITLKDKRTGKVYK